jgi:hypothetical protein
LIHKIRHKSFLQYTFSIYYQYLSNILSHLPRIISSWKSPLNSMVSNTISLWINSHLIPRYSILGIISLSHSFGITNQYFLSDFLEGNCRYYWISLVSIQPIDIINYSYPEIVNQFLFIFGLPSKLSMSRTLDIISLFTQSS